MEVIALGVPWYALTWFNNAPRCGARAKRNNRNLCRAPVIRGKKRCRFHGGSKGEYKCT